MLWWWDVSCVVGLAVVIYTCYIHMLYTHVIYSYIHMLYTHVIYSYIHMLYTHGFNLKEKKAPTTKGSMNECRILVGSSASSKVKNHRGKVITIMK